MADMAVGDRLRIGAVSYLNTKPLVYQLEEFAPSAELVYDLPSRLADDLAAGRLDVALIPSVEYFRHRGYAVISDACIACHGPVLSVKLLSRVPMASIRSLAMDEGSRTSEALVQILLKERFGLVPQFQLLPIGSGAETAEADAVLLIGDRAIRPPSGRFVEEWDLGEQWCRWAGLPFVFAMWTARPGLDTSEAAFALRKARDEGVAHLATIAEQNAAPVGLTTAACLSYLRDNLHFYLGPSERRGLAMFRRLAANLGLAPAASDSSNSDVPVHGCETT
jgi:chorismate dehydratase